MHETAGMRRRQRTRHLDPDLHDVANRQGSLLQAVPQRLALDELGDDVRTAVHLAEIVDDDDMRVVQTRGGSGFLMKPPQTIAIDGESGDRNLSATGRSSLASWAR